jgi:nickel-dependent lactate racemase
MLTELGVSTKKVPITVNRLYKEADLKILLSGVRPDLLLGFTGGRSLVLPGLSGKETLRAIYHFNNVADRNTRYGAFRDNPFHMAGVEATNMAGSDLCINVTLTPAGEPAHIFAGHFGKSQLDAMNKLREGMIVRVKEPMDIVVTSGGGAPYDASLPQILNTLAAVESVLKPDGTIVIAAAMKDGFGPPPFSKLFEGNNTVHEALERLSSPRSFIPGQWLAQRFYSILQSHEVILFNKDLNEDMLWAAGLSPSNDITQAVHEAMQSHGQRCKIVALPDGPMGISEISPPG